MNCFRLICLLLSNGLYRSSDKYNTIFLSNYNLLTKKEIVPIVHNIVKVENVVYVIVVNFQICTAL